MDQIGRSLTLSHLIFVYDVIFFVLGYIREVKRYK
jgi:hypothetical protein